MNPAPTTPVLDAIKAVFKTMRAIARALNITERAVYDWKGVVPKDRRWELYVLANGHLTLAQLELQEDFNARKLPSAKKRKKART